MILFRFATFFHPSNFSKTILTVQETWNISLIQSSFGCMYPSLPAKNERWKHFKHVSCYLPRSAASFCIAKKTLGAQVLRCHSNFRFQKSLNTLRSCVWLCCCMSIILTLAPFASRFALDVPSPQACESHGSTLTHVFPGGPIWLQCTDTLHCSGPSAISDYLLHLSCIRKFCSSWILTLTSTFAVSSWGLESEQNRGSPPTWIPHVFWSALCILVLS